MPDVDGLDPIEEMMDESASCCGVGAVAVLLSDVSPVAGVPALLLVPDAAVPVVEVALPAADVLLPTAAVVAAVDVAPACCKELNKPLGVYKDTPAPPPSEATIADCDAKSVAIDDKAPADVFGTTSGVGW